MYELPINEAARKLDIGVTVLKKYCRKFAIRRWPYRKLESLYKLVESISKYAASQPDPDPDPELRQSYVNVVNELQEFRWVGGVKVGMMSAWGGWGGWRWPLLLCTYRWIGGSMLRCITHRPPLSAHPGIRTGCFILPLPGTCHDALPHLSVLPPPVRACRVPVFITPCCITHVTYQVCSTHPADDCDAPTFPPYTRHACLSTPMLHISDMVYVGNTN